MAALIALVRLLSLVLYTLCDVGRLVKGERRQRLPLEPDQHVSAVVKAEQQRRRAQQLAVPIPSDG
jgi:hypothetical protein